VSLVLVLPVKTGLDWRSPKIDGRTLKVDDFFINLSCSWLYHEAIVHETEADEDGFLTATVIMDEATNNKFEKKFGHILS
jgi:hypothetical protein